MKYTTLLALFALSTACTKEEAKPEQGDIPTDTGVEEDTGGIVDCDATLSSTPSIELPTSSWFFRDAVELQFDEVNIALNLTLTDSSGADVSVGFEWNESREIAYVLPESGAWMGDEEYTLVADFCGKTETLTFGTSEYGLPLESDASSLVGNTYNIDLASAEYSHPPGIGTLLSQNIDQPLLFGIESASADSLDFIAALGAYTNTGGIEQTTGLWYFPGADFSTSPYFDAFADTLNIQYGSIDIPIFEFKIAGTFSADAQKIGMAHFEGLGDTRGISAELGTGDENMLCNLLANSGAGCVPCPNATGDEAFCVFLAGDIEEVLMVPNLILEDM
jgi:hypothetical protein